LPWLGHPTQKQGESMESLVIRHAYSNVLSPYRFSLFYLRKDIAKYDYDLLREAKLVQLVATVIGDESKVRAMTLPMFLRRWGISWRETVLSAKGNSYRKGAKYCPLCFSDDDIPFLRVLWRLNFAQVCLKHEVLLESKCGQCGSPFRPWTGNPRIATSISICPACGHPLSRMSPRHLAHDDPARIAASNLVGLLEGRITPKEIGWDSETEDFCAMIGFLFLFLKSIHSEVKTNERVPSEAQLLSRVYGEVWELVRDRTSLEHVIIDHQRSFNQYLRWRGCPRLLAKYRVGRLLPDWTAAERIDEELRLKGERVNLSTMARLTGISRRALSDKEDRFNFVKEEVRYSYRPQGLAEVEHKLEQIIAGMPISFPVQIRYLSRVSGIGRITLRENPRLASIIQDAKVRSNQYCSRLNPHEDALSISEGGLRHRIVVAHQGWHKSRKVSKIEFRCITCKKSFWVDVKDAPTHSQFTKY